MKQFKFQSLVDFKARNEGNGGFRAYATVFRELDDGGDIIMPGAYTETIPQFLERGFIAKGHDWNTHIAMPKDAGEDEVGLWVDANYHSTSIAQEDRTIALERNAAGLLNFVSIGYETSAPPILVNKADYSSELPKYIRPDLLADALMKADRFPVVRVLTKLHLYEVSSVSVPMLRSAEVTAVKGTTASGEGLGTSLTYSAHLKWLGTALVEFTDRTDRVREMDAKEGRVFSQANWDELVSLYERLGKLIEAGKPKPKQEDEESKQLIAEVVLAMVCRDIARRGVPIR